MAPRLDSGEIPLGRSRLVLWQYLQKSRILGIPGKSLRGASLVMASTMGKRWVKFLKGFAKDCLGSLRQVAWGDAVGAYGKKDLDGSAEALRASVFGDFGE